MTDKETIESTEPSEISLDNILNDITEEAKESEAVEKPVDDLDEAQKPAGDEKGAKKAATPAAKDKEAEEDESEKTWTKTAYLDEKKKRQAIEKEFQEFKSKGTGEKKKEEAPEKENIPDIFEDPEGYTQYMDTKRARERYEDRANLSTELLIDKHGKEKVNEIFGVFDELVEINPELLEKIFTVANPAKFAFETVEKHLARKKFDDPDYEKNLEASLRKKILAEMNGETEEEEEVEEAAEAKESKETETKEEPKAKKKIVDVPDLINASSAKIKVNKASLPGMDELFTN